MLGGAAVAAVALPLWRAWCVRTGLVDDPGHRKIHHEPVPLAGGLAVFTGMLIPILLGALALALHGTDTAAAPALTHGLERRGGQLAMLFGGAAGMVLLGWLDDKFELRPAVKFGGQVLVALAVALSGVRVTLFVPSELFSIVATVLWIVTVTNAFNFMDNMNGLCAGLGALGAFFFALLTAANGEYLVAITGFLMCGALAGFLPWNFPNARAFLGDAGSHLVGYLLAVMAILPHFYTQQNPRPLAVLAPLLVLAIPLLDLAQVTVFRTLNRKPFWLGDTNHLSHRLTRTGLSRTGAVLLLWLLAAVIGAAACRL